MLANSCSYQYTPTISSAILSRWKAKNKETKSLIMMASFYVKLMLQDKDLNIINQQTISPKSELSCNIKQCEQHSKSTAL